MFFKLRLQTFWFVLLAMSSLWVIDVYGPIIYSMLSPKSDLKEIALALESRGTPPPQLADGIQEIISSVGPMQRAIQVGYYSGVEATFQYKNSHTTKKTQVAYIAWFQKRPKPILLLISRLETDGSLTRYSINEGEPWSLARPMGLPLLTLAFSIFMVRKRRSPVLNDSPKAE